MNCVVALLFLVLASATAQSPDRFMQRIVAKMRRELGETAVGEPLTVASRQTKRNVSPSDAQLYVDAHNEARARISPKSSSPLPKMAWDQSLADLAQRYADQCIWGHNAQRSKNQNYGYVGENLFVTTATDVKPSAAVEAWESEKKDYTFATMKCNPGKMCGHYTQVVWHDSTHVGCGVKVCSTLRNSSMRKATLIVCNYGPGGNYRGDHPYET